MWNRAFLTLCVIGGLTLFACAEAPPETDATADAGSELADASDPCSPVALVMEAMTAGTRIFAGVTMETSTPIADILGSPDNFAGTTVRVEGTIVEICSSQGCYVTLQDADGNKLNLKVLDGELDFRDLVETGQYAVGEGVYTTEGEHGAQLDIMGAGAMVSSTACAF